MKNAKAGRAMKPGRAGLPAIQFGEVINPKVDFSKVDVKLGFRRHHGPGRCGCALQRCSMSVFQFRLSIWFSRRIEMKSLYAKFVLWVIGPALDAKDQSDSKRMFEVIRREVPPRWPDGTLVSDDPFRYASSG